MNALGHTIPLPRLALASLLLVGLGASAGCGDVSGVELGDFRCASTPCEVNFGELNLNRPGQTAKVEVNNIGTGELDLLSITLENTSPQIRFSDVTVRFIGDETGFDWRVNDDGHGFESTTPYVLSRNERLEIELTFDANGDGHGCPGEPQPGGTIACGEVVIESNDVDSDDRFVRAPIVVAVGDSRMEVNPTVIQFAPPQLIDAVSGTYAQQEREFSVTNLGTGNMILQNIVPDSAELNIEDSSGASYPITMIGGSERDFIITWTPTSEEALEAQITVTSNAVTGGTRVILVNSEGGDLPSIEVDPCDFFFGETPVGETSEMLFDVSNTGSAPMTWNVSITGVRPTSAREDFTILDGSDQPSMGQQDTLAAGQTRALKLVYTPTEAISVNGAVSFRGNFGAAFECPFAAGEAVAVAEVVPQQLYWGGLANEESESRSFVVYNVGRADLVVSSIDESGDSHEEWEVDAISAGGFTVAPGASRRVDVTYTRDADDLPAQDTATLSVNHNGSGSGVSQVFLSAIHGDEFLPPTCDLSVDPAEPYDVGETVTMDASGSELNAGIWATNQFQWNLERPNGSEATLSAEFGSVSTLEFDVAGTYVVGMVATAVVDGDSLSCEITRNLVVAPE